MDFMICYCMAFEYSDGSISVLVTDDFAEAQDNLEAAIEVDPSVNITYL